MNKRENGPMTSGILPKFYLHNLKSHGIRGLNQVSKDGTDIQQSSAWFDDIDLCIGSELKNRIFKLKNMAGSYKWNKVKYTVYFRYYFVRFILRMSSCQVNGAFGGRWGSSSISAASFKTFFGLSYASKIWFIISSHFERLDFHNLKYERALNNI